MTTADSGGHGPITAEVFARFIRCELEAYLHSREILGADREFADWRYRSRDRYKQAALAVLQSRYSDNEIHVGMPVSVRKNHAPPHPADPRGQIGARQDCRSTSPNCATTAGAEQALRRLRIPLQMPSRRSREG
jgi:hypothetical protein